MRVTVRRAGGMRALRLPVARERRYRYRTVVRGNSVMAAAQIDFWLLDVLLMIKM